MNLKQGYSIELIRKLLRLLFGELIISEQIKTVGLINSYVKKNSEIKYLIYKKRKCIII